VFAKIQRIHFVGIGGIGMSGIAEVLLNLGYKVSGSDLKASAVTERLATLGATIFEGHSSENIAGAEVVVASSAIAADNPELAEARQLHVPVIQRAEMLAELMRLKYGIAIAGMHGKTTTTSMVAAVLAAGGLDPTVVVGGRVDAMGSNARLGNSQYLVAEADESDRSFLKLSPILAVITNIDREHMDCYRNMRDVKRAFLDFTDRVPFYGTVVACNEDSLLRGIIQQIRRRVVTYGVRRGSDFMIKILDGETGVTPGGDARRSIDSAEDYPISHFTVAYKNQKLGNFRLHVPGLHNILNASAAIAVGVGLEIDIEHIRAGIEAFRGVDRRFQFRGAVGGIKVVDDYGHHPTEIRATLAAARQCGYNKIHVIFQPHRYTRTQLLMDDFATAFGDSDSLFLLDIYAASEKPIDGVTSNILARKIFEATGRAAMHASSFQDAVAAVTTVAQPGDMVLTLGAGSVSQIVPMIMEELQAKEAAIGSTTIAAAQK
jgi:UDP-N-acetylmuramate--alanine ligase